MWNPDLSLFLFQKPSDHDPHSIHYLLMKYSIKLILYFLHPCANTQGGTDLLIALRKGTDQPVKVIGRLLPLIKVCGRITFNLLVINGIKTRVSKHTPINQLQLKFD